MRARSRSAATVAGLSLHRALLACLSAIVSVLASAAESAPATAHDQALQPLRIDHAYVRPTPPGARTGGAYLTIRNVGTAPDRLVRVATPAAASAELHSMTMEGNVMKMRSVPGLDIPAGGSVSLSPGGYHVMLVGLARPLAVGAEVPLTLTFEKAGTIVVTAPVEAHEPGAVLAHPR